MLRFVRDIFIPHPGNGHRPHLLRDEVLAGIAALILVLETGYIIQVSVIGNGGGYLATIVANVLTDDTNAVRAAAGAGALQPNDLLTEAAQRKAEDMAAHSYFAHTSPDGVTPWHWFDEVGYSYAFAGENLAVNFTDSEDVMRAWLASPTHHANLVDPRFTEIGIGLAHGTYKGRDAIFVAQLFGRPAKAPIAPAGNPQVAGSTAIGTPAPEDVRVLGTAVADAVDARPLEPAAVAPQAPFRRASLLDAFLASPRRSADSIAYGIGVLVLIALLFRLFLRVEESHPHLLANGIIFLMLISVVLAMNHYFGPAAASVL